MLTHIYILKVNHNFTVQWVYHIISPCLVSNKKTKNNKKLAQSNSLKAKVIH